MKSSLDNHTLRGLAATGMLMWSLRFPVCSSIPRNHSPITY